ncbi:MAG: hypothetical protein ACR2NN_25655 [Bryobacteraceae bacterium]
MQPATSIRGAADGTLLSYQPYGKQGLLIADFVRSGVLVVIEQLLCA